MGEIETSVSIIRTRGTVIAIIAVDAVSGKVSDTGMRYFLAAIFLYLMLATPTWASSEEARAAYERGDYATALQLSRLLAEQGSADGQVFLGVMYEYGQGVPKDLSEAVAWYRKAAEQGNASGQVSLGVMYLSGQGVSKDAAEKDAAEAVKWFRKAAEQGHARGQINLGEMYATGLAPIIHDSHWV